MDEKKVLNLLKASNAMLEGHFLLTSGRHSQQYMQCAQLFKHPDYSEKVCAYLADKLKGQLGKQLKNNKIDYVVSPAIGGIIMGYEMSRQLKCDNIFVERENGEMKLRRNFTIPQGANVIVVEDAVTTGGTVKEVIELMIHTGVNVMAVCSIVDRSCGKADFKVPYVAAATINIESYEADECPLCEKGLPVVKPGSRAKQ